MARVAARAIDPEGCILNSLNGSIHHDRPEPVGFDALRDAQALIGSDLTSADRRRPLVNGRSIAIPGRRSARGVVLQFGMIAA